MAVHIQSRNDTSANWTLNNPILLKGELGFETDTLKFKLGDGTSSWNSLSYNPPGLSGYSGYSSTSGYSGYSGLSGFSGYSGNFGGNSQPYIFRSDWPPTSDSGFIWFNSTDYGSVDTIGISFFNAYNVNLTNWLSYFSSVKVVIYAQGDPSKFVVFDVDSSDNGGDWDLLFVSYNSGNGIFSDNQPVIISYAENIIGSPGTDGVSGYSGYSGISGYSGQNPGVSGYSGYSGDPVTYARERRKVFRISAQAKSNSLYQSGPYSTATTSGTPSYSVLNDSAFLGFLSGATNTNEAGFSVSSDPVANWYRPIFWTTFRTSSNISNCSFFIGLYQGVADYSNVPWNMIALRHSSSIDSSNWVFCHGDNSTGIRQDSGVPIAINTTYVFGFEYLSSTNCKFYLQSDLPALDTKPTLIYTATANLPVPNGTSTWALLHARLRTDENVAKTILFSNMFLSED